MDVSHVGQVLHARGDATQHAHQLDHCEMTVVLLRGKALEMAEMYVIISVIYLAKVDFGLIQLCITLKCVFATFKQV